MPSCCQFGPVGAELARVDALRPGGWEYGGFWWVALHSCLIRDSCVYYSKQRLVKFTGRVGLRDVSDIWSGEGTVGTAPPPHPYCTSCIPFGSTQHPYFASECVCVCVRECGAGRGSLSRARWCQLNSNGGVGGGILTKHSIISKLMWKTWNGGQ